MAKEYCELKPEDQEVVSKAMDMAIATFQDYGLPVDNLDHSDLLDALVDMFDRATS